MLCFCSCLGISWGGGLETFCGVLSSEFCLNRSGVRSRCYFCKVPQVILTCGQGYNPSPQIPCCYRLFVCLFVLRMALVILTSCELLGLLVTIRDEMRASGPKFSRVLHSQDGVGISIPSFPCSIYSGSEEPS